jgi:uncharacterized protein
MTEKTGLKLNDKGGYFFIEINEEIAAKMTFHFSDENTIVISHAEVNEAYNGRGYGKLMVRGAVDYARKEKIKIVPVCPFVIRVFEKSPEYNDVLKQ